jgi:hypothetical protein
MTNTRLCPPPFFQYSESSVPCFPLHSSIADALVSQDLVAFACCHQNTCILDIPLSPENKDHIFIVSCANIVPCHVAKQSGLPLRKRKTHCVDFKSAYDPQISRPQLAHVLVPTDVDTE